LHLSGVKMYRHQDTKTPYFPEFESFAVPFEGKLDKSNRWVIKASLLPLTLIEEIYAKNFSENMGAPAYNGRIAFCALYIKEELKLTDEEVVQQIRENPYLQYFLGYERYSYEKPFDESMLVHFRKRFSIQDLNTINIAIIENAKNKKRQNKNKKEEDQKEGKSDNIEENKNKKEEVNVIKNEGKMIVDSTCVPCDIKYPTDLDLLNEAREKAEMIIDKLYEPSYGKKPRTYRKIGRKKYLIAIKRKKKDKKFLRKAIGEQLRFIKRDIRHIEKLVKALGLSKLSKYEYKCLLVIQEVYRQQEEMYKSRSNKIDDRIVSITQPYIRPIVRGKAARNVEFGCKISVSCVNGFSYIDHLSWDNYNEGDILRNQIELYKKRFGFYPKEILADKIYRTKKNRELCNELGIKLIGVPLGNKKLNEIYEKSRESERNIIEGKFGESKRRYSLGRIMTKLSNTTTTVISMVFIAMNLNKIIRNIYFVFIRFCLFFSNFKLFYISTFNQKYFFRKT